MGTPWEYWDNVRLRTHTLISTRSVRVLELISMSSSHLDFSNYKETPSSTVSFLGISLSKKTFKIGQQKLHAANRLVCLPGHPHWKPCGRTCASSFVRLNETSPRTTWLHIVALWSVNLILFRLTMNRSTKMLL